MHLHVTDQSIRASKQGEHLRLTRNGELVGDYLLSDIKSAAFYGATRPTTDSLLALLDAGADVTFLSKSGKFKGRMVSSLGNNVNLRLLQYGIYNDPFKSFEIAQKLIENKVENGFALLDFYRRNPHNNFAFDERRKYSAAIRSVKNCIPGDLDKLRGYEGRCANLYFGAFARCINENTGIRFPGRQYHPCTDPVNSLLSLGYAFVAREVESLLISYSFDPMIGVFHTPEYGRASLALDVMEEFRHPLVDRLVLKLVNRKILNIENFEFREDGGPAGSLCLKRDALCKFIQYYEQMCDSPNRICAEAPNITWRTLMRKRVEDLRNAVLGNQELPLVKYDFNLQEAA